LVPLKPGDTERKVCCISFTDSVKPSLEKNVSYDQKMALMLFLFNFRRRFCAVVGFAVDIAG
jgi:hypothetical protein